MNAYYPHPSYMPSYRQMTPKSFSLFNAIEWYKQTGKPTLVNSMEIKVEDGIDDPSKQQMFHPMMQSRPRVPYYPNMQGQVPASPHPNPSYYPNSVQRTTRPKL